MRVLALVRLLAEVLDPTAEVIWGPDSTDEMFIGYMNFCAAPAGMAPPR